MARAIYAEKEIFLLDDPVSALDTDVRKNIFHRVFNGLLKEKTRVLVTHAVEFLHLADKVIVMEGGEIVANGTYEEVIVHPIVKEIERIHCENNGGVRENIPINDMPELSDTQVSEKMKAFSNNYHENSGKLINPITESVISKSTISKTITLLGGKIICLMITLSFFI